MRKLVSCHHGSWYFNSLYSYLSVESGGGATGVILQSPRFPRVALKFDFFRLRKLSGLERSDFTKSQVNVPQQNKFISFKFGFVMACLQFILRPAQSLAAFQNFCPAQSFDKRQFLYFVFHSRPGRLAAWSSAPICK